MLRNLGREVLRQAFYDATDAPAPSLTPLKRTQLIDQRRQAREFLLHEEVDGMLLFWCRVAEVPVQTVVIAARALRARSWRRTRIDAGRGW